LFVTLYFRTISKTVGGGECNSEMGKLTSFRDNQSRRGSACPGHVNCDFSANRQRSGRPYQCLTSVPVNSLSCIRKALSLYFDQELCRNSCIAWNVGEFIYAFSGPHA